MSKSRLITELVKTQAAKLGAFRIHLHLHLLLDSTALTRFWFGTFQFMRALKFYPISRWMLPSVDRDGKPQTQFLACSPIHRQRHLRADICYC